MTTTPTKEQRIVMEFGGSLTTFVDTAPDGSETIWLDVEDSAHGPLPLAVEPPSDSLLLGAYILMRMVLAPSKDEIEDIARRMRRRQRADDWAEVNEATRNVYRRDALTALYAQGEIILERMP